MVQFLVRDGTDEGARTGGALLEDAESLQHPAL